MYSGAVALTTTLAGGSYQLSDPTRGGVRTGDAGNRTDSCSPLFGCTYASAPLFTDADDLWGNGTTSSRQTAAVDAQYGATRMWSYFLDVHGRLGMRNDGVGTLNRVHYGTNYNNANWDPGCFCARFGDGDGTNYTPWTSLDVVSHELTHGVTDATAHITYSGEGAGLHESISDIFGTLVEFHASNPADPPDYTIGEKIRPSGVPLRWMDRPSRDSYSPDCWYSGIGNIGAHVAAGPGNHFFYLLAVGSGASAWGTSPTCNGSTVAGIGNADAGRIVYRAVTVYMTSGTNYKGARIATLSAAADLFGPTSSQYARTAAAWSAVNVNP